MRRRGAHGMSKERISLKIRIRAAPSFRRGRPGGGETPSRPGALPECPRGRPRSGKDAGAYDFPEKTEDGPPTQLRLPTFSKLQIKLLQNQKESSKLSYE